MPLTFSEGAKINLSIKNLNVVYPKKHVNLLSLDVNMSLNKKSRICFILRT